jgi:hypothetical protein
MERRQRQHGRKGLVGAVQRLGRTGRISLSALQERRPDPALRRPTVSAYTNQQGQPGASLELEVTNIVFIGGNRNGGGNVQPQAEQEGGQQTEQTLRF